MRKYILSFGSIFFFFAVVGQHPLSASRQTSVNTYIYRLTTDETATLSGAGLHRVNEKYLHTLLDSFQTDSNEPPALKPGNYLFAYAKANNIFYTLRTVGDVQFKLVNNNRDLVVALHTREGKLISDASVFIGNKRIFFDATTKTYRLSKRKKTGLVKAYREGVVYLFPLGIASKQKHTWYRIAHSFPLKYLVTPWQRLSDRDNHYTDYFNRPVAHEKKFTGFMVFSKPKYKPGDTVKLKAYILTARGKPVTRPLLVRLTASSFDADTILSIIKPYRSGGYEFQFVLTDSLALDVDDQQLITLEELKSSKYNLDKYEGELDDDEYAAKRKILVRGKFKYEDYELGSLHFFARTDKQEHHRGNPVSVYLKATDENDMAVMDGRIQLVVVRDEYGGNYFDGPHVFLPDTLWNHTQTLETIGETKIEIPDSIFPAASFAYNIQCNLLSSDNKFETKTLTESFQNDKRKIYFIRQSDSLRVEQRVNTQLEKTSGTLYVLDSKNDTIQQLAMRLPGTVIVNPFAKYYEMETDSCHAVFEPARSGAGISCVAMRTRDSVRVSVINPDRLYFWYCIFAGEKMIDRGYGDSLNYTGQTKTRKNYFVSLQYIYGDRVYNEDYTVPYQDRLLTIKTEQPEFVYPGQTASVAITVTDAVGKPVENADVTAYGFTNKFENERAPYIPYAGKIYPGRKRYPDFYGNQLQNNSVAGIFNWMRWSREMGLDSIEYFRFLHPQTFYTSAEPVSDSITQLAPFVVMNGDLEPVHQVYIDEVPSFFDQAQQLPRYSFGVTAGKHSLRLRTNNKIITIDSVWAGKGLKTIISINADTVANKLIRVEKMPDSLTNYEKALWSKYMILMEDHFGENFAVTSQSGNVYLLNPAGQNDNYRGTILAGPFKQVPALLSVKNKFSQSFEPEGNYRFDIASGLIKQKQFPAGRYVFSSFLSGQQAERPFSDRVLSEREIESLWEDYLDHRSADEELFRNTELKKINNGRLQVDIDWQPGTLFIKNIFLFRYDDPDFTRVYKGSSRNLGYVEPGNYRLFILFKGDDYFVKDSVEVKKDGLNYYRLKNIVPVKKDNISTRIAQIMGNREKKWKSSNQDQDLGIIKESFNEKYLDIAAFQFFCYGSVKDARNNLFISGASVIIKGTKTGTVTDAQGLYTLRVPSKGILVFSAVGYETVEKRITPGENAEIRLLPMSQSMREVVVTAYGTARKRALTGSSSIVNGDMLSGKAPGVIIRGAAGLTPQKAPLILVDGLPYTGDLQKLDSSVVVSLTVLKSAEATALYGAMGAYGVIFITTRKNSARNAFDNRPNSLPAGNMLRHNFRDDAFWQPRLHTDANGKASFNIVFPDDITNWRTFVIAMGRHKQSGFIERSVKSFKSLSAGLSIPLFAVEGDTLQVIGKVLNYTPDSTRVKREFTINGLPDSRAVLTVRNAVIDTFSVAAGTGDSLKLKYTIEKEDGYFDGEERSIPVFKRGVTETKGIFSSLERDTSFSFEMDETGGKIKIYAEASLLPVLIDEIEGIRQYEYLCNEQLASKLKALLLKKKVYLYLKKNFKENRNIEELIAKLGQNKTQAGLWGWWNNSEPLLWVSLHVTGALLQAEQQGYKINLNKTMISNYLVYNLENNTGTEKLSCLFLLKALDAKVDFKKYIDSIEKDIPRSTLYEKLSILRLKQDLGIPVSLDSLSAKYNTTMFGNIYWGDDTYRFFDNSIQNTILMYQLMQRQGGYEMQLRKVRSYFLEKRKDGRWRNTYESSLILESILPDLLKESPVAGPASLVINSGQTIRSFPYATEINAGTNITIRKQGVEPVYFTAFQQTWNHDPGKVSGNFDVSGFFEHNGQPLTVLKVGEESTLTIQVTVKADADYVMVEIPIPAGCSYKEKSQGFLYNEVHREYFKNKVCIFCSSLRKGGYVFKISLLPRYTGHYFLNPAKAEMMYFPVFYGREKEKTILIR